MFVLNWSKPLGPSIIDNGLHEVLHIDLHNRNACLLVAMSLITNGCF